MADINTIINQYKNVSGGLIEAYHAIQRSTTTFPKKLSPRLLGYFRYPLPKRTGLRPSIPISRSGKEDVM